MRVFFLCIVFLSFLTISCKVKSEGFKECDIETLMNKKKYSRIGTYKVSIPDSITRDEQITQLAFHCTYIQAIPKVIYDEFGLWSRTLQIENHKDPILIWDSINIEGVAKNITLISGYHLHRKKPITDIIILDKHGKDLLKETSNQRTSLISYFSKLLRESKINNNDFFIKYDNSFPKVSN